MREYIKNQETQDNRLEQPTLTATFGWRIEAGPTSTASATEIRDPRTQTNYVLGRQAHEAT
jgi:hypothetical protein